MDTPTHYEVLCVTPDATADEIRNSYRRLIRLHHPDVCGVAGEAMTHRLNDAKHELLDPQLRARYDRAHSPARVGAHVGAHASSEREQPTGRSAGYPSPRPGAARTPPVAVPSSGNRVWRAVAGTSIAAILGITLVVFAWSYSGPLDLTTPRAVPPLVIALGWLVGGIARPPRLVIALLALGSALGPLVAFGVAPFAGLSPEVPPMILGLLTVLGFAVLTLRVSAIRVSAIRIHASRVRSSRAGGAAAYRASSG